MGHPVFLPFFLWHISLFHLYVTGYIVISLAEHWMIGSRYRGYLKECTYSSHYLHNVDYNLNYTLPSLGVFEGLSSVIGLLGRKGLLHQTWVTAPGRGAPLRNSSKFWAGARSASPNFWSGKRSGAALLYLLIHSTPFGSSFQFKKPMFYLILLFKMNLVPEMN